MLAEILEYLVIVKKTSISPPFFFFFALDSHGILPKKSTNLLSIIFLSCFLLSFPPLPFLNHERCKFTVAFIKAVLQTESNLVEPSFSCFLYFTYHIYCKYIPRTYQAASCCTAFQNTYPLVKISHCHRFSSWMTVRCTKKGCSVFLCKPSASPVL